jgi:hypothetical protein
MPKTHSIPGCVTWLDGLIFFSIYPEIVKTRAAK